MSNWRASGGQIRGFAPNQRDASSSFKRIFHRFGRGPSYIFRLCKLPVLWLSRESDTFFQYRDVKRRLGKNTNTRCKNTNTRCKNRLRNSLESYSVSRWLIPVIRELPTDISELPRIFKHRRTIVTQCTRKWIYNSVNKCCKLFKLAYEVIPRERERERETRSILYAPFFPLLLIKLDKLMHTECPETLCVLCEISFAFLPAGEPS